MMKMTMKMLMMITWCLLLIKTTESHTSSSSRPHQQTCRWRTHIIDSLSPIDFISKPHIKHEIDITSLLKQHRVFDILPNKKTGDKAYAFPYFLQLEIECDIDEMTEGMTNTMFTTGVRPEVRITYNGLHGALAAVDLVLYGAAVNRACLSTDNNNNNNNSSSLNCEGNTIFCDVRWYIPLPVYADVRVMPVHVTSRGIGPTVVDLDTVLVYDGYWLTDNATDDTGLNVMGSSVTLDSLTVTADNLTSTPLIRKHRASPVSILTPFTQSNIVLVSTDEFATVGAIQVSLPVDIVSSTDAVCTVYTDKTDILSAATLADRLIFATPYGLMEIQALSIESRTEEDYDVRSIILPACIRKLIVSPERLGLNPYVLAIGDDPNTNQLFIASEIISTGDGSLYFTEIVFNSTSDDTMSTTTTVCGVLHTVSITAVTDCTLISTCVSLLTANTLLTLVSSQHQYYIIESVLNENNISSKIVANLSSTIPSGLTDNNITELTDEVQADSPGQFHLSDMSYTRLVFDYVLIWGDVLLYSDDGCKHVYYLHDLSSISNITILTTTSDGHYTFLTDDGQLWYGSLGYYKIERLRPSDGWDFFEFLGTISPRNSSSKSLSLFVDDSGQLVEIIADINDTDYMSVKREDIVFISLLQFNRYSNVAAEQIFLLSVSDDMNFTVEDQCPFQSFEFSADMILRYLSIQQYYLTEPRVSNRHKIHDITSLLVYQAVTYDILHQHSLDIQSYAATSYDPLARWRRETEGLLEYHSYMYANNLMENGITIDTYDYVKYFQGDSELLNVFPSSIYLEKNEIFSFKLQLVLNRNSGLSVDDLLLVFNVADSDYLSVNFTRGISTTSPLVVVYDVTVTETGSLHYQHPPGKMLKPTAFMITVKGSELKCFNKNDYKQPSLTGRHAVTVLLGCPPSKRLLFDATRTLKYLTDIGRSIYPCYDESSKLPCFYFNFGFFPFFLILDQATGTYEPFSGKYTFTVIGGSHLGVDEIELFSKSDTKLYNTQNEAHSSLIWGPMSFHSGTGPVPVFTQNHSGITWLCQRYSPCANIPVQFPHSPQYYFLIEVSNKDVDTETSCEYTVQFVLHVHGLPIDAIRMSLVITMTTIALICIHVFIYYWCRRDNARFETALRSAVHNYLHRRVVPEHSAPL